MDSIVIEIQGFLEIKKLISELPLHIQDAADAEMEEGAREFILLAHKDAPVDQGEIKRTTKYERIGIAHYDIFSQSSYAGYMEFGTKGNYTPIPGAEAIAAKFRGKGEGTFKQMVRAIVAWVGRKGIAGTYSTGIKKNKDGTFTTSKSKGKRRGSKINQLAEDYAAAWPIIMSIMKNGVKAHPYFFKQQGIVVPKMINRINLAIADLINK